MCDHQEELFSFPAEYFEGNGEVFPGQREDPVLERVMVRVFGLERPGDDVYHRVFDCSFVGGYELQEFGAQFGPCLPRVDPTFHHRCVKDGPRALSPGG